MPRAGFRNVRNRHSEAARPKNLDLQGEIPPLRSAQGRDDVRAGGFTLLEVLIVVILLGIVGLSFGYLYTTAQRFMIQSLNFTGTQNEASFALEHIKRNLLVATAIAQPTAGNPGTTLEFTYQLTDPANPNGAPLNRTSRYQLTGSTVEFVPNTANAGVIELVARNVSAITFERTNATTVRVNVTAQQTSGGDTRNTRLETTVTPRGVFQ